MSRPKITKVIEIIKKIKNLKTDSQFAKYYGKQPNTVAMWKKRNKIPADFLRYICEKEKINLDWFFAEEGLRVGETGPTWLPPGLDLTTQQILALLKNMPDEQKKEILHYIEEKTLLKKLLAERKKKPKEV